MGTKVDKLTEQAMSLSPDERAALAERLWASLSASDRESVHQAWAEEIERRIDELESGRVQSIPADQVFAEIEATLKSQDR